MKFDHSIDCLGLFCPMPIIKTAEKISDLQEDEVLEIVSDDKGIVEDMPNWCKITGHEFLGIEQNGDEYRAYVKKKKK